MLKENKPALEQQRYLLNLAVSNFDSFVVAGEANLEFSKEALDKDEADVEVDRQKGLDQVDRYLVKIEQPIAKMRTIANATTLIEPEPTPLPE